VPQRSSHPKPQLSPRRQCEPGSPRWQAARDLATLLETPRGERVGRVAKARGRFRGALLAEGLLTESRQRLLAHPADPREAHDLAEAAKAVLYSSDLDPDDAPGLWVLTLACLGNALRLQQREPGKAAKHLWGARFVFEVQGLSDAVLWAELDRLATDLPALER